MGLHRSLLESLWNGHLDNRKDKKCLFVNIDTYLIATSQVRRQKLLKTVKNKSKTVKCLGCGYQELKVVHVEKLY